MTQKESVTFEQKYIREVSYRPSNLGFQEYLQSIFPTY